MTNKVKPRRCKPKQAYASERGVGEQGEAFEQVLVVVVLDHRRPVGLQQETETAQTG